MTKEDITESIYELNVQGNKIKVAKRKTAKTETDIMTAEFEYKGIFYQLRGKMEKEEFDEILKNLKFY